MAQPLGFHNSELKDYVCKLDKAIYGLKQAPHAWYLRLHKFLISIGFFNSLSDQSLFINSTSLGKIFVVVYVDDFIVIGDNRQNIDCFISNLCSEFKCRDLGQLHFFSRIEAIYKPNGSIVLSQS